MTRHSLDLPLYTPVAITIEKVTCLQLPPALVSVSCSPSCISPKQIDVTYADLFSSLDLSTSDQINVAIDEITAPHFSTGVTRVIDSSSETE